MLKKHIVKILLFVAVFSHYITNTTKSEPLSLERRIEFQYDTFHALPQFNVINTIKTIKIQTLLENIQEIENNKTTGQKIPQKNVDIDKLSHTIEKIYLLLKIKKMEELAKKQKERINILEHKPVEEIKEENFNYNEFCKKFKNLSDKIKKAKDEKNIENKCNELVTEANKLLNEIKNNKTTGQAPQKNVDIDKLSHTIEKIYLLLKIKKMEESIKKQTEIINRLTDNPTQEIIKEENFNHNEFCEKFKDLSNEIKKAKKEGGVNIENPEYNELVTKANNLLNEIENNQKTNKLVNKQQELSNNLEGSIQDIGNMNNMNNKNNIEIIH